jgi:hypothetical protein
MVVLAPPVMTSQRTMVSAVYPTRTQRMELRYGVSWGIGRKRAARRAR